jgi:hypothetical protein
MYESWRSAVRSGDARAAAVAVEQLEWLARESVYLREACAHDPFALRLLRDALGPVARDVEGVRLVLQRAGWS